MLPGITAKTAAEMILMSKAQTQATLVKRYGTGPRAIVGLHGWSGTYQTFEPLVRYLPADTSLYCFDLPGYGAAPSPTEWTLAALAEAVEVAIAQVPASRFTLLGNCSGALLGLESAPRWAGRLERLVMLDPFAFVPWYFRLFLEWSWGKYAYYSAFANPLGRWLTNLSLARHRTTETDLTASFQRVNHTVSFRYLQLLAALGSIERFRALRVPTDIVYGARSFQAIKQSVRLWQQLWPHARAWELAEAGHLPLLEATEALSRIVFHQQVFHQQEGIYDCNSTPVYRRVS